MNVVQYALMVNLFDKKKNEEGAAPEKLQKEVSFKRENTPEERALREREFVWAEYDTRSRKKTGDWYFVLWTIAIAGAVGAVLVNNPLFGLFLVLAGFSMTIYGARKQRLVEFKVNKKGIQADTIFLLLSSFSHFYVAENSEPLYLLLQSKNKLLPIYSFPIATNVDIDALRSFLAIFLEEQEMEVPFYQRLIDQSGF